MSASVAAGGFPVMVVDGGKSIPWYIIPFDEAGRCTGPETRRKLLDEARDGGYTDLYLFSHGWNNNWKDATTAYEGFIRGYMAMRKEHNLPAREGYKPLLVGVFWPSVVLLTGDESAPQIAAGGEGDDDAQAFERREVERLAAGLPDAQADRFFELSRRDALTPSEAAELGRMLMPWASDAGTDPSPEIAPPRGDGAVGEIVAALAEKSGLAPATDEGPADFENFGLQQPGEDPPAALPAGADPDAAGWFSDQVKRILPRDAIRVFTVYQMKDRAGVVGAKGVAPLLTDLLTASGARVHLIGHSYGAKVLLSAACVPPALPRQVDSILLLQPAVSHLCFAAAVPGRNGPGGYRRAFDRVRLPILSTYSEHDFPLHETFHLAVRRREDLGELKVAAAGEPPSIYAALGGYGPRGSGEKNIKIIPVPGARYPLGQGAPRIYGLDGSATIPGHGGISNPSTWWALYNQVSS